jgi:hypothetical protein
VAGDLYHSLVGCFLISVKAEKMDKKASKTKKKAKKRTKKSKHFKKKGKKSTTQNEPMKNMDSTPAR